MRLARIAVTVSAFLLSMAMAGVEAEEPLRALAASRPDRAALEKAFGAPTAGGASEPLCEYRDAASRFDRIAAQFDASGRAVLIALYPREGDSAAASGFLAALGVPADARSRLDARRGIFEIDSVGWPHYFVIGSGDPRGGGSVNFAFILWDEAEAPSKSPHVAPVVDVLLALGAAEAYGRQTDADRNTIADYWTADVSGLYRVERMPNGSGKPLALIDRAIASADARPMGDGNTTPGGTIPDLALTTAALVGGLPREPYLGYWFAAVPGFAEDPDGDGKAWTHATRFGICAFPASYGESSKESYLIGESGVVWAHDLGKAAAIEAWPADPAQSGWRPISGIPGGMPIALLEGACAAFLRGVDTRFAEPSTSLRLLGRLLECTPTAVASRPPVVELLMMLWRLCDERNPEFERHDWPAVEKGALELRNTPQAVPLADRLIEWARSERGGKETGVDPSSAGS